MPHSTPVWRLLYLGWLAVAARFGFVQTLVILTFCYVVLFGPVGLGLALARADHLGKRILGAGGSAWRDADTAAADLERAKLLS